MKKSLNFTHLSSNKWLVYLLLLLVCVPSCSLLTRRHIHIPFLLSQAEVIFEDSFGNYYFEYDWYASPVLKKYSYATKNHYINFVFSDNDLGVNYNAGASNSNYFFAYLSTIYADEYIEMYDKSFSPVKRIYIADDELVHDLVCSDDALYYCTKNKSNASFSIIRWLYDSDVTETIGSNITGPYRFKDDDECFYFNIFDDWGYRGYLGKYGEAIVSTKRKGRFLTDFFNLYKSNDCIIVEADGSVESYKQNYASDSYFSFYKKVYLEENTLIFATLHQTKNNECGFDDNINWCSCGNRESYLYSYDFSSKSLSLINTYEPGTYLIDYKDGKVVYYYKGGLYVDGILVRNCETVESNEIVEIGSLETMDHDDLRLDYYLSYNNGEIFGI